MLVFLKHVKRFHGHTRVAKTDGGGNFFFKNQVFSVPETDIRIGFIVANNQLQLAAEVTADFVDFIDGNLSAHARTVAHVGRTAGEREYQPDLDGVAVSR